MTSLATHTVRLPLIAALLLSAGCTVHIYQNTGRAPDRQPTSAGDHGDRPEVATPHSAATESQSKRPKRRPAPRHPRATADSQPEPVKARPAAPPEGKQPKPHSKPEKPIAADDPPQKPPSSQAEPPSPVPPKKPFTDRTRLVLPIAVGLSALEKALDRGLPKKDSRDWSPATEPGQSPAVEVRYKATREPVEVKAHDGALRVTIPVRYAADVRAKVKNPVGSDWFWLTQGETWGTEADPQSLEVTIDVSVSRNGWDLQTQSKLVAIRHSGAPAGQVCLNAGVQLCVPKSQLSSRVTAELDKHLVPRIERELAASDRHLAKVVNLRDRAQTLWKELHTPLLVARSDAQHCPAAVDGSCSKELWLAPEWSRLGLGELSIDKKGVHWAVGLEGRLATTWGKPKAHKPKALPEATAVAPPGRLEIATTLELNSKAWEKAIRSFLKSKQVHVGDERVGFRGVKVKVAGGRQIRLTVELEKLAQPLVLTGDMQLAADGTVEPRELKLDKNSTELLEREFPALDRDRWIGSLKKALTFRYEVSSALEAALARSLAGSRAGDWSVDTQFEPFTLSKLDTEPGRLLLGIELAGSVSLELGAN